MFKNMQMKMLSFTLSVGMVLGGMPTSALAAKVKSTGAEQVYISISEDDQFVEDKNGKAITYRAVDLSKLDSIDLDDYGLSDYKYDADGDGDDETTALHLFIYVHETILGNDWSLVDTSNGFPGGMFFTSGLFGFTDENLRYNYNGRYPADESGWGFTADNIVLSAGDFMEVAHFQDFNFYMDSAYGFRYFTDENDETSICFTAEAGDPFDVKVNRVSGGMGLEESVVFESGATVYYGKSVDKAVGEVMTDEDGNTEITFPSGGIWYIWSDSGLGMDMACGSVVTSPAFATVTVSEEEIPTPNEPSKPETSGEAQDVSAVLNATMAQMADTVTEPTFGTNAGEWTVLSLARGEYFAQDDEYFAEYYERIEEKVDELATKYCADSYDTDKYEVLDGALHNKKSTDNSRLIVALSSIGKDAANVGGWDLTAPYNDFGWIKNQGINGIIWALIALDSNNYETEDESIRQQCIDQLLELELETGGWPMSGGSFDNDITGMALQALYPYRDQPEVEEAAERAFEYLSEIQLESGGFKYGTAETSESSSQMIVACATWGINPDTDSRFIKNGNSIVDNLLTYYIEDEAMFAHQGTASNNMATDQACYALVAYDRLLDGKTALYDFSDVDFETSGSSSGTSGKKDMAVSIGIPKKMNAQTKTLKATIDINGWDNQAGFKLFDFILLVPKALNVNVENAIVPGKNLVGGEVQYHLEVTPEDEPNKLRVVYFDAANNGDITISGDSFPAELIAVNFDVEDITAIDSLNLAISGFSLKLSSDSFDKSSQLVVDSTKADVDVKVEHSAYTLNASCLYIGDNVDLIPDTKKAIVLTLEGEQVDENTSISYIKTENPIQFLYSHEISEKTGKTSYVALVNASIANEHFGNLENYEIDESGEQTPNSITFGDSNGDGIINAQDALNVVNAWLRKTNEPKNKEILAMNVNGDGRLNTFDALGIVESFVYGMEHRVLTRILQIFK